MEWGKIFAQVTSGMLWTVLTVAGLVSLSITGGAMFGDGCVSGETPFKFRLGCREQIEIAAPDKFAEQFAAVEEKISKLQLRLSTQETTSPPSSKGIKENPDNYLLLQVGAVVAFTTGCPKDGWVEYKEGWGRVIIGAFSADRLKEIPGGFIRDGRGLDLTPKPFEQPGGEEMHVLTNDEMPNHAHEYDTEDGTDGNRSGRQDATYSRKKALTSAIGGGLAHNNLPPYVPLNYCRKL